MSTGWSIFVIVLTISNIIGGTAFLWWTSRSRGKSGETTGHVWDGDLTEYNKPMPRWWIVLFYVTHVWALGYLLWYPGMGDYEGMGGWSSRAEHAQDVAEAEARLRPLFARFAEVPIQQLAGDPEALRLGQSVFANNCTTCHGSDARGAKGFPNLADASWQWGGTPERILESILQGRTGVMPPLGAALGEQGVTAAAAYVQSLSGADVDSFFEARGRQHFQTLCAACHGPQGKGNAALGAPDLTDDIWLYGGDFAAIRASIAQGRTGQMPAHEAIIGRDRARLAAAYVWSLSQPPATTGAAAAGTDGAGAR